MSHGSQNYCLPGFSTLFAKRHGGATILCYICPKLEPAPSPVFQSEVCGGKVREPLACLISGMVPLLPQEYLLTSCCASSQSSTKIYLSSFPRSAFLSALHLHIPSLSHTGISPIPAPPFLCYSYSGPQCPVQLINLMSYSPYLTFIFSSTPSPILLPMSSIEQHSRFSLQVLESQGSISREGGRKGE